MIVRFTLLAAYIIFVLNVGDSIRLPGYNVLEKGLFLAASVACIAFRPFSKTVALLFGACSLMIFVLGALTPYPQFSWVTLILSLNQITILYALLAFHPTRRDCETFLILAALMPIASIVVGSVYDLAHLRPLFRREFATGLYRLQGSTIAAYLSGLAMCGMFASLQLAAAGRKAFFFLVLILDMLILLLAGGRIALAVSLLVCTAGFYSNRSISGRWKVLGSIAGLIGAFVAGLIFAPSIMDRFEQSGSNGRDLLWAEVYKLALAYPNTGIGFGHQFWALDRHVLIMTGTTAAHNDYYRLMAELGFYGMPLFYLFLILAVLRVWANPRVNFNVTVIAALVGYLMLSWTDNALSGPAFFPIIILAIMASVRYRGADESQVISVPRSSSKTIMKKAPREITKSPNAMNPSAQTPD